MLSELDVAHLAGAWSNDMPAMTPAAAPSNCSAVRNFKVGKLIAFGTQLDQVRLVMKRVAASWALQIDSRPSAP